MVARLAHLPRPSVAVKSEGAWSVRTELGFGVVLALAASSAAAAPTVYLSTVESPVYDARGSVEALSRKANVCIAQLVSSGLTTAPTILSSDPVSGVIVARNTFEYHETVWGSPLYQTARTRLTFEAREGRFRLSHSDIQVLNGDWRPIRAAKPGKVDEMRDQLLAQADKIASCIKADRGEW